MLFLLFTSFSCFLKSFFILCLKRKCYPTNKITLKKCPGSLHHQRVYLVTLISRKVLMCEQNKNSEAPRPSANSGKGLHISGSQPGLWHPCVSLFLFSPGFCSLFGDRGHDINRSTPHHLQAFDFCCSRLTPRKRLISYINSLLSTVLPFGIHCVLYRRHFSHRRNVWFDNDNVPSFLSMSPFDGSDRPFNQFHPNQIL